MPRRACASCASPAVRAGGWGPRTWPPCGRGFPSAPSDEGGPTVARKRKQEAAHTASRDEMRRLLEAGKADPGDDGAGLGVAGRVEENGGGGGRGGGPGTRRSNPS